MLLLTVAFMEPLTIHVRSGHRLRPLLDEASRQPKVRNDLRGMPLVTVAFMEPLTIYLAIARALLCTNLALSASMQTSPLAQQPASARASPQATASTASVANQRWRCISGEGCLPLAFMESLTICASMTSTFGQDITSEPLQK